MPTYLLVRTSSFGCHEEARVAMGAYHPAQGHDTGVQLRHPICHLRVGHDHQRARIAAEAAVVRICDHADDLPRRLFKVRPHAMSDDDLLSYRVLLGEELLRKGFINERDKGCADFAISERGSWL